jgi:hypothetical protein
VNQKARFVSLAAADSTTTATSTSVNLHQDHNLLQSISIIHTSKMPIDTSAHQKRTVLAFVLVNVGLYGWLQRARHGARKTNRRAEKTAKKVEKENVKAEKAAKKKAAKKSGGE